jgi:hypothetical protein
VELWGIRLLFVVTYSWRWRKFSAAFNQRRTDRIDREANLIICSWLTRLYKSYCCHLESVEWISRVVEYVLPALLNLVPLVDGEWINERTDLPALEKLAKVPALAPGCRVAC